MQEPTRTGQKLRVLYVEDSARDAKLSGRQLEQAGFDLTADIVTNPAQFLDALHQNDYDLILADYHLPEWSGLEALHLLRNEGREIPFILLTGTVGEETAVEAIKMGATDYVLKDRPARLPHAIRRALEEQQAREERRRAERSRDLLASIVQSSDDAIVGMSIEGRIASWNRGAQLIFQYAEEEIAGHPIAKLLPADQAQSVERDLDQIRGGKSIARYETLGLRKNGETVDIAVTMSPIFDSAGRITGASAIARDITDTKRLMQEFLTAQKMEAIGRLAAGVAHDFNNLLTVVSGYTSLILDDLEPQSPFYEEVLEISKAGQRATSLTRQLLAFSRKQIVQPGILKLNAIVADMDRMLRRLIGEDIDLKTFLAPDLGSVKADPGQIEQIIMNLAVNARDAMPKGGKLTIETANIEIDETYTERHVGFQKGAAVMLAVTDTGIGMDAETQARIFEPFFTTKGAGQGTGLGLATVYGIVEQCGGKILVYSEVGHGTTFKICFPRVHEAGTAAAQKSTEAPKTQRGEGTILVVEDEDPVRNLVTNILKKAGYTVIEARNGAAALETCAKHGHIDLMVSDVVMPNMSGSDLLAKMREIRPKIKVLFMSGYTDNAVAHHGHLDQESAFIHKPFVPSALTRKVREILEKE